MKWFFRRKTNLFGMIEGTLSETSLANKSTRHTMAKPDCSRNKSRSALAAEDNRLWNKTTRQKKEN